MGQIYTVVSDENRTITGVSLTGSANELGNARPWTPLNGIRAGSINAKRFLSSYDINV